MKELRILLIAFGIVVFAGCSSQGGNDEKLGTANSTAMAASEEGKPIHLTYESFKELVWDFEKNPQEWKYEGSEPCIIDFYADWCQPCKRIAPIMEELATEYKGKIKIYKVDTQTEKELARVFQIRSIPAVLFSPLDGKPMMQTGAYPKDMYVKVIEENLLKKNTTEQTSEKSNEL